MKLNKFLLKLSSEIMNNSSKLIKNLQICNTCIMDTSDEDISFDETGQCSHCISFYNSLKKNWTPGTKEVLKELDDIVVSMKEKQKNQEYDAIIGLSGGVDSSYLAYWARKEANLRLLAVHVDAGWNSDLAVRNIEEIVKKLDIQLFTEVVDWEAIKDVQTAFFKAGVANQDTPQDHAFFSVLYSFAEKNNIKYVINGNNYTSESVLPVAWGHDAMDSVHMKDICRQYGGKKWKKFPFVSTFKYHVFIPRIRKMQIISPLNYIDYKKMDAIKVLEEKLNWQYYGGKHYESRFTKFFQSYWLPKKFGYDKRKAHFSSLILSEEITRDEALDEMKKNSYDESTIEQDIDYICKKLDVRKEDFISWMNEPNKKFSDYKNNVFIKKLIYSFIIEFSNLKSRVNIFSKIKYILARIKYISLKILSKLKN
tara:strand:- start:6006 stop:7277 length:1272 start_codon:yes stop_codon:yes gene_type:complete